MSDDTPLGDAEPPTSEHPSTEHPSTEHPSTEPPSTDPVAAMPEPAMPESDSPAAPETASDTRPAEPADTRPAEPADTRPAEPAETLPGESGAAPEIESAPEAADGETSGPDAGIPDGASVIEPPEAPPGEHPGASDEQRQAIEAMVMVAHDPVPPELLAQLLEVPVTSIEAWVAELAQGYLATGHGFEMVKVAGGYRYQSRPDMAPYVERFLLHDQRARLSGAALETLAIVAYKQPISRAQIAAIRGVDPDGVLRTLHGRGYIDQIGRDPGPGQAVLFGTTTLFLEQLGLASLDDLPPIAQFVPGADVVEALEAGLGLSGDTA